MKKNYIFTAILTLSVLISTFIITTPTPRAELNLKEYEIEKYTREFDRTALEKILIDYNTLSLEEKNKLNPRQYYLLARTCEGLLSYYEAGDNEKYVSDMAILGSQLAQKAIEMDQSLSDAHRVLSRFLAKQLNWGNIYQLGPRVLSELDNANKTDPQNYRAILGKVVIYLYAPPMFGGDLDLAVTKLLDYTKKYPDFEDGFINLGIAYKSKGNKNKAREVFQAILKNNPRNLTAKKELNHL